MPATLTAAQVYAVLTEPQAEAVNSYLPAGAGALTPLQEEIVAALARVDHYTAGWSPAAPLLTAWARDIAVWHILKRINLATEAHKQAYDAAITELTALRDGKSPHTATAATTNSPVSYGGREKVL